MVLLHPCVLNVCSMLASRPAEDVSTPVCCGVHVVHNYNIWQLIFLNSFF